MDNANKNETANINEELLTDVAGGNIPASMQSSYCAVCGKLTPNVNLVTHHLKKVCKRCMEKIRDDQSPQPHGSGASGGW